MDTEASNPQTVLTELKQALVAGAITKAQVMAVLEQNQQSEHPEHNQHLHQPVTFQKLFTYIGGLIVFLGIAVFIAQFWGDLDQFARTLIPLGSAISAYTLGYFFLRQKKTIDLGHAFFIIAAVLFPLGIAMALKTIGVSPSQSWGISINAAVLFMLYFATYASLKLEIFLPFAIASVSTLFFSSTNMLFGDTNVPSRFYEYRLLIVGASYLLLAYAVKARISFVAAFLNFFGLPFVLATAMFLQGYAPNATLVWEVTYPFLLIGFFWLSIVLQSRLYLVMATVFTLVEIVKLTAEYFSKSLGWPLSLIIAGLVIMGIGFASFSVNKKYFHKTPTL